MSELDSPSNQPFTIPVGDFGLNVSNIHQDGGTGSFAGTIEFGGVDLTVHYKYPGDYKLTGDFPSVKLSQIIRGLIDAPEPLAFPIDITFGETFVLIEKNGEDVVFQCGTNVSGLGTLAFDVQKTSGKWGYAFGLDMGNAALSAIGALSPLSWFTTSFRMTNLLLVASSFTDSGFKFEDASTINGTLHPVHLPASAGGLTKGLTVYASWTFDQSKEQQALVKLLGLSSESMGITLRITSQSDIRFYFDVDNLLGLDADIQVGAAEIGGEPELYLLGQLKNVKIDGRPYEIHVALAFLTNGLLISGTLSSGSAIQFGPFSIGDVALELGMDFEGVPSFGFFGTITAGNFMASVAVFIDSEDPAKSMFAGSVSDVDLGAVLSALEVPPALSGALAHVKIAGTAGSPISNGDGLLAKLKNRNYAAISQAFSGAGNPGIGNSSQDLLVSRGQNDDTWFLMSLANGELRHYELKRNGGAFNVEVNAQFAFVPQRTQIGSYTFAQEVFIDGTLSFFDLSVSAKLLIDPSRGFMADATMSPFHLGTQALFSVTSVDGSSGPSFSVKTYDDAHLYINGKVTILGISDSVYVHIDSEGAKFDLKGSFLGIITTDLHGTINGSTDLSISGDLTIAIGDIDLGLLGTFHIDSGVNASANFYVNGGEMGASLKVDFAIGGYAIDLGTVTLDINTEAFKNIGSVISTALIDFFKANWKFWVQLASNVLGWGEDKVRDVLKAFDLSDDEINAIFAAAKAACAVTSALGLL